MKHLLIGLCLLGLLLMISILILCLTYHFVAAAEAVLCTLPEIPETGSTEAVLPLIQKSQDIWDSHRGFFRSVFSHTALEEIDQGFAALTAYAKQGEAGELRDVHARMMDMLRELREMDLPYYYNILTGYPYSFGRLPLMQAAEFFSFHFQPQYGIITVSVVFQKLFQEKE